MDNIIVQLEDRTLNQLTGFVVIAKQCLGYKLIKLREEVNLQIADLVPDDFNFMLGSMPIGSAQERNLSIKSVVKLCTKESLMGMETYMIGFRITEAHKLSSTPVNYDDKLDTLRAWKSKSLALTPTSEKLDSTATNSIPIPVDDIDSFVDQDNDTTNNDDSDCETEIGKDAFSCFFSNKKESSKSITPPKNKKRKISSFFQVIDKSEGKTVCQSTLTPNPPNKSPFPAATSKGLKIYTKSNIDGMSKEMERQYCRFWNEKAEALCKESVYQNWSKHGLIGVINCSWTLRKTVLLQEEIKQMEIDMDDYLGMDQTKSINLAGVKRNEERLRVASNSVLELNKKIKLQEQEMKNATGVEKSKIREDVKMQRKILDGHYAELKKAQDSLRKSLTSAKEKFEELKRKDTETKENEIVVSTITEEEENAIKNSVMEE